MMPAPRSAHATAYRKLYGPYRRGLSDICEYHCGMGQNLACVTLDPWLIDMQPRGRRELITGPMYLCENCQKTLAPYFTPCSIIIDEKEMKIQDCVDTEADEKRVNAILDLRDKFNCITNAYIIPHDQLSQKYRNSLNIALEFSSFSVLSYCGWAYQHDKSIMNLWNNENTRAKFWSVKITRLLIALGKMQADINNLDIWIRTHARVFHIDYFCKAPSGLTRLVPKSLIKLDR